MQVDNRCGCVALPAMLLKCHASSHLSFSHPGASGLSFNVPAWSGESPPHPGASCMSKCLSALGRAACSAHVMPSTLVQVGQCKPVITTQVLRKTWHCRPFATDQYAKTSTRRMRSRPDVKQKATAVEGAKLPSSAGPDSQPQRASEDDKKRLIDRVDAFIFDCDGVIWRGDSLIEGIPETLDMLKSLGKKLVFVTNNATKSRAGYLQKFKKLGLNVEAEEIYSSSYAAAAYLESVNFPKDKKVYVIGDVGIEEELKLKGINYMGGPSDADQKVELSAGYALPHDPDVGAVVVGFDRRINYYKIQYACLCIRENPGCLFIATNLDAVTHLTDAQEWAGNGAMVGAIKGCTKREPIVVGKPAEFMLENIANAFGMERKQICMVGDRLDTDILFGQDGGLSTMLVLSGVTTEKELLSPENKVHPDYYTDQLSDLLTVKDKLKA